MSNIVIICTIIGTIPIFLTGVWFIIEKSMKLGETKMKICQLEEKTKHSNCEHNSAVIKSVETNIEELVRDFSYLKGQLSVFLSNQSQSLSKSFSPMSLTELGLQVSNEIGAEEMIERNWEVIFLKLENDIKDKNAYDIQQYCVEYIAIYPELFLQKEDVAKLKDYAYKSGKPLVHYSPVFGLPIRDRYMKIKGIHVEEIDKHAPNNVE